MSINGPQGYEPKIQQEFGSPDVLNIARAKFWDTLRAVVSATFLLLVIPVTYLVWSAALGRIL